MPAATDPDARNRHFSLVYSQRRVRIFISDEFPSGENHLIKTIKESTRKWLPE